jgi:polysaccharide deacetylase family protein (PEP-CTERM system associated)
MNRNIINDQFLFSIDVEDVRLGSANGLSFKPRVSENIDIYLTWLRNHNFKCTFFVVGETAALYPSVIKEIISEGHEIACHTMQHKVLSQYTQDEFQNDLENNVEILLKLGVKEIIGFRAPSYSLTKNTEWVYDILKRNGFVYSSSVLPAKNPLFKGWPEFGVTPREIKNGIIEIPITVGRLGPLKIPVAGGIYFRALPLIVLKYMIKKRRSVDNPLVGYFHPYDIDTEQERFMQGGINNNKIYNWLMYYNRGSVLTKLNLVIENGYKVQTYSEYLKSGLIIGSIKKIV